MTFPSEPKDCFYDSHGLRLHYVDWGNDSAPPLILLHGGRDHCRSWDRLAKALQPHFHVMAKDLRGHGDSAWAAGSSYNIADHVYDLARMVAVIGVADTAIVGHSFGGMISMAYAGAFPQRVSRLAVIDGAFLPNESKTPIDRQFVKWSEDLDKISQSEHYHYASIADAAARMSARNKRLTPELALHLAAHAVRRNDDGTFSWKFDEYQRVRAPYRLLREDYVTLWSHIACPMLLLCGSESFMPDPQAAGLMAHFRNAERKIIEGAAHWIQHDKPDEVLSELRAFFGVG